MGQTPKPGSARRPDIDRRTLTGFGYVVCVVVPVLVAVLGVAILWLAHDADDRLSGQRISILTSDWQPGQGGDGALAVGQLVLDEDRCVRLLPGEGPEVDVVWPDGYTATVERIGSTDRLRIYDAELEVVARGGDTVRLGGGYHGSAAHAGEQAGRACAAGRGEFFFVQSDVTVVPGA